MKPRPATIDDYRTLYAGDYGERNVVKRYAETLPLIQARMPATILEVGCGRGEFVETMANSGCPYVVGVDPAMWSTPVQTPGYRMEQRSISGLEWSGMSVGYVCSFDVLEHLPETEIPDAIRIMTDVSTRGQFHAIYNGPDQHRINGELVELHVTQRPADWWVEQFSACNREVLVHPSHHCRGRRFILEIRQ